MRNLSDMLPIIIKEADLVSERIAAILSEEAFAFSVPQFIGIHSRLFSGIYIRKRQLPTFPC